MLTPVELTKAKLFLQQATTSVHWVALTFQIAGDWPAAARLNSIGARLADERAAVERMIAKAAD